MQNPYTPPSAKLSEPEAITLSGARLLRTYQRLLILSTVAYILGAVLMYLPVPWSEEVMRVRAYDGYGSIITATLGRLYTPIWLVLFTSALVARIGMYFLERWARTLFVAMYVVSIVIVLVHGVSVLTPLEGAVATVAALADGAILTFAYTEPLSHAFKTTEV